MGDGAPCGMRRGTGAWGQVLECSNLHWQKSELHRLSLIVQLARSPADRNRAQYMHAVLYKSAIILDHFAAWFG